MSKKILVTGGAGFIGSHLVDALLAQGHEIRVLDTLVPQVHGQGADWPAWLPAQVEKIRGEVSDPLVWARALKGVDVVYHLAAEVGVGQSMYEIVRYMNANTLGTAHFLELLVHGKHSIEKVVVASSMSIYGEGAYQTRSGKKVYPQLRQVKQLEQRQWELIDPDSGEQLAPIPTAEDKPLYPTSIYAISKRDQEEMCLSVGRAYKIPTVALRFFNVYGPRQALSNPYTGVAAIFSGRLLNGNSPLIFEDGLQSRDFVHVSDIVQGLVLAMERDAANYEAINIGTGRCISILEVANALIQELQVSVEPQINQQFREGDIRHCYADISKAQRLLGYQPKVKFEQGVGDLVEWVRRQKAQDMVEAATAELVAHGLTR
ncbi:MAG: NAD-dependent epimerase/dehydratase family protein [Chloroflexota bacterium]|nr:MAG: NAD-dependent epimerase/dehydratase family protein [Chloroflexota bacterium]